MESSTLLENIFTENSTGMYNFPKGSAKRSLFPLVAQRRCEEFVSIFVARGSGDLSPELSLWGDSSQPMHI